MKQDLLFNSPLRKSPPEEHKELKEGNFALHYYTSGKEDGDAILFLHPAFADHRCFYKQTGFFAEKYRVITVDLPGHGESKLYGSGVKMDQSAGYLKRILNTEGYDSAHIVGVSMGSLVAQFFALKHKSMVRSLTSLGGYNINTDNREVARAQRSENLKWIWKAMISMDSFRRYVARVSVYREEEKLRYFEMARLFTRRSFSAMSGLGVILQKRKEVKRIYPMMILCGEKDLDLTRRISKEWHESEPGSEYHQIKNAGHCANMDKGPEFNEILFNFLEKNS